MDEPHRRLRPALEAAFGALDPDEVVLDLGAGSGLGVRQLAQTTRARIIAVEPSLTMRAVLLARIVDDSTLTDRVSVLAGAVPDVFEQLPGQVAGFVCGHMLAHLSPADRAQTFAALAGRLAPTGAGVVTVNGMTAPPSGPAVEERLIGGHRYVARHLPPGAGGDADSEYEVYDADGLLLRAARFAADWTTITEDLLRSELAPAGWELTAREDAATVLLVTREPEGEQ
jgi:SAM-dependent methyltransferase